MVSQCEKKFNNMNNNNKTHLPNQRNNQPKMKLRTTIHCDNRLVHEQGWVVTHHADGHQGEVFYENMRKHT